MSIKWDHGIYGYASCKRCGCGLCVAAVRRHAARLDGIIDPVAVERLVAGDHVWATHEELREAAAELSTRGWTASQIAVRLGQSDRTAKRLLAEHRAQLVAA